MSREHDIRLFVNFRDPIGIEGEIAFEQPFRQGVADSVVISNTGICIRYQRKSNSSPSKAINATRIRYLQSSLLALSCLEGITDAPLIGSISYSCDGGDEKTIAVPEQLSNLDLKYEGVRYSRSVVEKALNYSSLSKALLISISYCWAAARAHSQEERLKLLWGAFNAQYRYYYRSQEGDAASPLEVKMLDCVSKLFLRGQVLNKSLAVFEKRIGFEHYESFVRWKLLTGSKSRSLFIREGEKKKNASEKEDRLRQLDKETLLFMRNDGCGEVPGKRRLKKTLTELVETDLVESSQIKKVAMVLCRYIYIMRCDGMHANVQYPVFEAEGTSEKAKLADLLEAAVVDLAEWHSDDAHCFA